MKPMPLTAWPARALALLWRGDFQNARQLLQAMARRADRKPHKAAPSPAEVFNYYRQAQSQRARILSMLLIPLDAISVYRYGARLICDRLVARPMALTVSRP